MDENSGRPGAEDWDHHGEVRRSVFEMAVYLSAKVVPFLCNIAFIKFYTAYYSKEVIGRYEAILALGWVASSLASGWLQVSFLRLYPESLRKGRVGEFLLSVGISFSTSMALCGALLGGLWLCRNRPMGVSLEFGLMGWVFFFCVGNSLFLVTTTYLRALRKPEKFTFFTSLLSLLTLFGTIALTFLLGANLTALMVGIGGSLFALGVWIPLATQDPKAAFRWSESWGQVGASLRPLLHFGLPLAVHAASSQILNVSSRYIILILRGEEEAGIYSVVYRMADTFVRAILLALITTVYTSVTETYEKSGAAAAERIVGTYTRLFLLLTAPAAAGLALIQTEVVELLAGPSYVDGAHLVTWIAMGTLFLGLSHYQQFGLHLGHQTLRLAGMTLCAAILNVLITVGLAPTQGYSAAGYAAFASFLFLALVSPVISRKWLAWRMPWRLIAKIGIALLVMAAAVHGAGLLAEGLVARLALKVLVGALAYGVTVIALGELPLGALARASLRYRGPSEPGG